MNPSSRTKRSAAARATAITPALIALFAGAPASAEDTTLPLRSIVLYRSGVGYFERSGQVQGEQRVQLRFDTAQVNDILKSMVLFDLDGGRVNAVTYNSNEPLARRLRSFGVDISDAPNIASLLERQRGSAISLVGPEGPVEGIILGVEHRAQPARPDKGETPAPQHFVNLVTSSGIRSVMISAIASFRFVDERLNDELNKALLALAEQRAERTKAVDLSFSGPEGALRRVVVAYIHEMPVWKTSYRLVLPEPASGADPGARGALTMQGWAIVENTTDNDWRDVRLSLASGRPVSFTMDLYEPFFMARPMLPIPGATALRPRDYAAPAAARDSVRRSATADAAEMTMSQRGALSPESGRGDGQFALTGDEAVKYAAGPQATGGEVGEQFLYTLDLPVTLERQRSAMLPILSAPVEGRRVSIFNRTDTPLHPMRGVEFTNSSALHLMPGPVAVFDASAYAGDATIPHTSRGQKRLLAYALDIDVSASVESLPAPQTILSITIADGVMVERTKQVDSTRYRFTNHDSSRPRLIIVEHPKNAGWDLTAPDRAPDETDSLYRFDLPVEAGKNGELTVTLERTARSTMQLATYSPERLMHYARQGKASPAVVEAFRTAAAIQARINDAQRRLAELDAARREISDDQARIRGNIGAVDRNSDLYRRYIATLSEQESTLENNRAQRLAVGAERDAAENELREFLRSLRVD